MSDAESNNPKAKWSPATKLVFFFFLALVLGLIAYEHWLHFLGFLPYLLLAACPLMHVFMHRSHGHQHGSEPPNYQAGGKK